YIASMDFSRNFSSTLILSFLVCSKAYKDCMVLTRICRLVNMILKEHFYIKKGWEIFHPAKIVFIVGSRGNIFQPPISSSFVLFFSLVDTILGNFQCGQVRGDFIVIGRVENFQSGVVYIFCFSKGLFFVIAFQFSIYIDDPPCV